MPAASRRPRPRTATKLASAEPAFQARSGADPLGSLSYQPRQGSPRRIAVDRDPMPMRLAHPVHTPLWVRWAGWWRQTTTGVAVVTCALTAGIYSWTVYTQHRWSVQYEALEQMERHDRQFQLTQESMVNSLRETASRSEMVPLVPERLIEVPITPGLAVEIPYAPEGEAQGSRGSFAVGY